MEPFLDLMYEKYGYDHALVRNFGAGERYLAIELVNGNIGIAGTEGRVFDEDLPVKIDLDNHFHRVLLNAYYNALINYRTETLIEDGDILKVVDFSQYKNIYMIGFFRPVYEKMQERGWEVKVFDPRFPDISLPMDKEKEYLADADAIIITALTLSKHYDLIEIMEASPESDKFILGPSSLMAAEMCEYGIKGVFGVQFKPYDTYVISLAKQGYGTPYFLPRATKMALLCGNTNAK